MNIQDKIKASNELQSEIRKQTFMVPECYAGTIDPKMKNIYYGIKVYGDSCGPICPEKYFAKENYRILYILRETYIGSLEEEKFLSEGYDKASIYREYEYDDLEKTYKNVANLAYSLLTNSTDFVDKTAIMDCFRQNVCIINTNYFPCIAITKSNYKYICEWARINEDLIKRQVELYEPSIIIGGHTLGNFLDCATINNDSGKLFGRRMNFLYSSKIMELFGDNFGENNDTYYDDKDLWINTYHPSYDGFMQKANVILKIRDYWSQIVKR